MADETVYENIAVRRQVQGLTITIDKIIIEKYLAKIGVYGLAVYCALNIKAENGMPAVPLATIAGWVKCSTKTVARAIDDLVRVGLVVVKSGKKEGQKNTYIIVTPPEVLAAINFHDDALRAEKEQPTKPYQPPPDNLVAFRGVGLQSPTPPRTPESYPPPRVGLQSPTPRCHESYPPTLDAHEKEPLSELSLKTSTTTKTKAKATTPAAPVYELPEWLDKDAWRGYEAMRKAKRAPMTDRARELILAKLNTMRLNGLNPTEALDQSTTSNWTDVFEPKGNGSRGGFNGNGNVNARTARNQSAVEQVKQDIARAAGVDYGSGGSYGGSDGD